MGLIPEEIVRKFGHLSLAQVHAALACYHAMEIDADLDSEAQETKALACEPADLVAALRSRGVPVVTALDAGFAWKSDDKQFRRILRLRATTSTVSMRNQVEFLGNWG